MLHDQALSPGLAAVNVIEAPLPAKQIAALDAADLCTIEGDEPQIMVTDCRPADSGTRHRLSLRTDAADHTPCRPAGHDRRQSLPIQGWGASGIGSSSLRLHQN
jgi:hypothetical protein